MPLLRGSQGEAGQVRVAVSAVCSVLVLLGIPGGCRDGPDPTAGPGGTLGVSGELLRAARAASVPPEGAGRKAWPASRRWSPSAVRAVATAFAGGVSEPRWPGGSREGARRGGVSPGAAGALVWRRFAAREPR